MRKIKIFAIVLLILLSVLLGGCSAKKYLGYAKDAVDDYYDDYSDGDYDDIVDTIHDGLLELLSEEDFTTMYETRMYYFGEVDEYDIVGTNISYENGATYVEYQIEVEYDSGDDFLEILEYVFDGDDEAQLIAVDIPTD